MSTEITHAAYRAMVPINQPCERVENGKCYRKTFFYVHGVWVFYIENFISNVTQYYVNDINL